ncbi:MAG: Crp/Fnr family transcriptional regulator [Planctomycetota bacterium]|nr:Crp/Fnr family transcriptional regulator [Planctomycetota bacterium]
MEPREMLGRCRLFARLSASAREQLAAMAELCELPAGRCLFRQGDPCPGVGIVGSGLVRIYKLSPQGREQVLHLAGPGSTFAEAAVIGEFPCPACAEAVEDSCLTVLPAAEFRAFLRRDHQACIDLLAGLAAWLHHVVDLLGDVALRDALGRVARYALQHADGAGLVHAPVPRKHLAAHLNLTPEALSRTLRKLADDGCLVVEREAIRVRDAARLAAIADGC